MKDGINYCGDYKPVNVMKNNVKLAGWIPSEKTGTSVEWENTYNDVITGVISGNTVQQSSYPWDVSDAGNCAFISKNQDNSKSSTINLPVPLRKIGTIADTYNLETGIYNKKLSDMVIIQGNMIQNCSQASGLNGVRSIYTTPDYSSLSNVSQGYKYDGSPLINNSHTIVDSARALSSDGRIYIGVGMLDSGWSNSLVLSQSELRTYFYGWKMCHSDGVSPYYKSETPYTPTTWAEWFKGTGTTFSVSGSSITLFGSDVSTIYPQMYISFTAKELSKYLVIGHISANTLINSTAFGNTSAFTSPTRILGGTTGYFKLVHTATSSGSKPFIIVLPNTENSSRSITFDSIRVYELPVGSQIEYDANNLTADQLAAKYPFEGLCIKYWKHVTDGLGLTSVLPTASYDGYTPYKMMYQLATPIYTQLNIGTLKTYPHYTMLTQSGNDVLCDIEASVKIIGI